MVVPGKLVEYPGANIGVDEAIDKYSIVIAQVIQSKSFVTDSSDEIRTAYKFRILETISRKSVDFCSTCPTLPEVSGKFDSILPNEFVLQLSGGTVTVDGIQVTMVSDRELQFQIGERYLLFLSFVPGGAARLAAGPSGAFHIIAEDSLEGLSNGKQRLPMDITERFTKSLSKFRKVFRPPPTN